jgi:hypothetical protein
MGISKIILKRSINLSKTYLLIALVMGVLALGLSSVPSVLPGAGGDEIPIDTDTYFSFIFIAFASMTAVLIATPVLLLFVYDKNNGVLEYLLSTGMTQTELFWSYLQAALALAGALLLTLVAGNSAITLIVGGGTALLPLIAALTFVLGLSAVAFTTVLMMAFSSLQKQRVGANQPLGIGLGVFLVIPSYILPAIFAEIGFTIVSMNAAIAFALALVSFLLSGRLVKREKLLP